VCGGELTGELTVVLGGVDVGEDAVMVSDGLGDGDRDRRGDGEGAALVLRGATGDGAGCARCVTGAAGDGTTTGTVAGEFTSGT
jgi:hypothetical protein